MANSIEMFRIQKQQIIQFKKYMCTEYRTKLWINRWTKIETKTKLNEKMIYILNEAEK